MSSSSSSATLFGSTSVVAPTTSTSSPPPQQQTTTTTTTHPTPSPGGGGPPYAPKTAQLGGIPSPVPDIPISLILALLFVAGAAANMTVFRRNRRRSYKFLFSALVVVFCMARVVALGLRCAWAAAAAAHPRDDVRVAMAAQIFTAAGVLVLFVTNLVFAQRVVRAYHPFFGWSRGVTWLFRGLFGSAVVVLVMVVAVTVQGFFVKEGDRTRAVDRRVQLFCVVYLAVYAFLPVPLVTLAAVVPRRTRIDKFGEGHFRTKFALLTVTASLLALGATFRAVAGFYTRPVGDPAWFHGKACYYCFNFVVELVVVYTYALSRFDKRFHIPDGSSAPGHYSFCEEGEPAKTPNSRRAPSVVRATSSTYGEGPSESSLQLEAEERGWTTSANEGGEQSKSASPND
ncbi:hypothetical protein C8A00DRAFT_47480 [Chaetomidium leptoderma]|uniref:Uncharacterized protein n=1 Tax=Chaetomidium leptoderma TaxID=669021 RepID=A0AAN6VCC8_9PEZI|nr:hypothetical protein C8A00DRAFT_47480 [Chaetomidium leptoderma]